MPTYFAFKPYKYMYTATFLCAPTSKQCWRVGESVNRCILQILLRKSSNTSERKRKKKEGGNKTRQPHREVWLVHNARFSLLVLQHNKYPFHSETQKKSATENSHGSMFSASLPANLEKLEKIITETPRIGRHGRISQISTNKRNQPLRGRGRNKKSRHLYTASLLLRQEKKWRALSPHFFFPFL